MRKGDHIEGIVTKVSYPNRGFIQTEEGKVLIKNAIPGQKVHGCINKKKGKRLEARLLEVVEASPLETEEKACSLFPDCGGCMYQTMNYEKQLEMKALQVKELLEPVCHPLPFEGIASGPKVWNYRNKMEYSFGDAAKDGPLELGLHKKGSTYDILTAGDCAIVSEDFNRIVQAVKVYFRGTKDSYYHKMSHQGYLRHLLLRRAEGTGEILAALVTSSQGTMDEAAFTDCLLKLPLEGTIVGILHILNDSLADVVQSDETRILYGQDHFYEEILGLRFCITPFSFFQTNSRGAEKLYSIVREWIGNVDDATVFDLYSGTGTIAQVLAPSAKEVIGVEIVEEAVEAARKNAALNGITNCRFLANDVLKALDEITEKPDFIILDPPRDGIHPKALPRILEYGVERIVYVSCKATSLARDLELILQSGYTLEKVCCVDMFPHTVHVETVCLLSRG